MPNYTPNLQGYKKLKPFKMWVAQSFPYIEADFDAITNYELLCKVTQYLNDVITNENAVENNVNLLLNAFNSLQQYVNTYFENELPELVNNKLDEMAQDGTLERLIGQYIDEYIERSFLNVNDMKYENLEADVKCRTMGYYQVNDGGGASYIIRDEEPQGYYELMNNGKFAELIYDKKINVLQVGLKNDASADCSQKLQNLVNLIGEDKTIFFPNGHFLFNSSITLKNHQRLIGEAYNIYSTLDNQASYIEFNGVDGFICDHNDFENLVIHGKNKSGNGIRNIAFLKNCTIGYFRNGFYGQGQVDSCNIHECYQGIIGIIDSKIINNTINKNEYAGINLQAGNNDNIITGNKIEWNDGHGLTAYQTNNNIITNNIFDRNYLKGVNLTASNNTTISNNIFRRNHVSTTAEYISQLLVSSSSNCSIISNIVLTGNSEDDESGDIVPTTGVRVRTSNNLNIIGNTLNNAGTSRNISIDSNQENVLVLNKLAEVNTSSKIINVPVGETKLNIPVTFPVQNQSPLTYHFRFCWRTSTNASYGMSDTLITLFLLYGTGKRATISNNEIASNITFSITFEEDGNITLNFNNTTNNAIELKIDILPY